VIARGDGPKWRQLFTKSQSSGSGQSGTGVPPVSSLTTPNSLAGDLIQLPVSGSTTQVAQLDLLNTDIASNPSEVVA
jgi:hypothetical protein